ncbi:hypothetical protein BST36_12050 [Mycolicibacterium moriokaense]|nr:hypothetical protein BST36_12050 [Mycolicibacterium moriokaense]
MGERVTGVRVTPISGSFVVRVDGVCGRRVCAGGGAIGSADSSGGGGGGGGGSDGDGDGRRLVAGSVDAADVGAVESTDVVSSSALTGARTINTTAETTSAAAAVPAATQAISACLRRYHGGGAGSKYQVLESNASKAPLRTGGAAPLSSGASGSSSAPSPKSVSAVCAGASGRSPIR